MIKVEHLKQMLKTRFTLRNDTQGSLRDLKIQNLLWWTDQLTDQLTETDETSKQPIEGYPKQPILVFKWSLSLAFVKSKD